VVTSAAARAASNRRDRPIDRIDLAEWGKGHVVRRRIAALRERLRPGQHGGEAIGIGGLERHEQTDRSSARFYRGRHRQRTDCFCG